MRFDDGVGRVLDECWSICNKRGLEYSDSWATENIQTVFLSAVLRAYPEQDMIPKVRRLMVIAAVCDVKLSRMVGEYKRDTVIDLINYLAFFADLMKEGVAEKEPVIDFPIPLDEMKKRVDVISRGLVFTPTVYSETDSAKKAGRKKTTSRRKKH